MCTWDVSMDTSLWYPVLSVHSAQVAHGDESTLVPQCRLNGPGTRVPDSVCLIAGSQDLMTTCGLQAVVVPPLSHICTLASDSGSVLLPFAALRRTLHTHDLGTLRSPRAGASLPCSPFLDGSFFSTFRLGGSLYAHSGSPTAVRLPLLPADPRFGPEACRVSAVAPA